MRAIYPKIVWKSIQAKRRAGCFYGIKKDFKTWECQFWQDARIVSGCGNETPDCRARHKLMLVGKLFPAISGLLKKNFQHEK
jgi:hypothetical protein